MSGRHLPTPAALRALDRRDPVLGRARRQVEPFPGFPQRGGSHPRTHFEALARSIVFQQLAGAAARTIFERVRALTPGTGFPKAPELLGLSDKRLRGAGLSAGKLASLRDLAGRVEAGELRLASIARRDDEAIVEALTAVRGIGPWTARMFLMFRLGRLDVFAPDDLGLREGARRLDGLDDRPAPKVLAERAQAWAPLRSVASWVLWRLTDVEDPG